MVAHSILKLVIYMGVYMCYLSISTLLQNTWAAGMLNNISLFNVTVPFGQLKSHGFAGVGTSSWGHADFDNVKLATPSGASVNVQ